jgi:lipopolysaccharide transport system ATP-binding protein
MSTAAAISIEGLSKAYRLGHQLQKSETVGEAFFSALAAPFKRFRHMSSDNHEGNEDETFWALKDVTFDIKAGEVFGIVGRNGAGKSTMLKVLSRITEPTSGRAILRGRVASLLEVGTGFHRELTGRENIFLNGAILGMKKAEIVRKFDQIVAFSEIEKFLDTPVKHYSSGMYVRLAFAVAAHLEPEILIVDEVLAVGDAEFQKKCLGKMQEVASGDGRTVLFVSHNMGAVRRLCHSAVYLQNGQVVNLGPADQIVDQYLNQALPDGMEIALSDRPRTKGLTRTITGFAAKPAEGYESITPGGSVVFELTYDAPETIRNATVNILIDSDRSERLMGFNTRWEHGPITLKAGRNVVRCRTDDFLLAPGRYTVDLVIWSSDKRVDAVEKAAIFDVKYADYYGTGEMPQPAQTRILRRSQWEF